jgi:hypothetical protein
MALDGTEVRLFGGGHLYVAPVGTVMPTDLTTPLAAAWLELGYCDTDGLELQISTDSADFFAWQTLDPVRTVITSRVLTAHFKLMQRNKDTIPVALGGGTLSTTTGVTTYTPPTGADVFERAFVLETQDGSVTDRYRIQRATVSDIGAFSARRDQATVFELTVKALAPASGATWDFITDDANVVVP